MNGNDYLVDTNIVLYLLSGDQTLAKILTGGKIYVSEITEIELLSYPDISAQEEVRIKAFLADVIVIQLNEQIKAHTISLRRKYRLKLPDAMIAATAQHMNLPLISADRRLEQIEEVSFFLYEFEG